MILFKLGLLRNVIFVRLLCVVFSDLSISGIVLIRFDDNTLRFLGTAILIFIADNKKGIKNETSLSQDVSVYTDNPSK